MNLVTNFSGISNKGLMGRLLRLPLSLIPSDIRLPILQGRLRGKRWIVGSSNHGCWLGSYEYQKQILFAEMIQEGSVVFDIGAHVGFYTLLSSQIVGPKGKAIAFEPLPRNIHYLKEHLRVNQCKKNVTVIEAAVVERSGFTFFEEGSNNHTGRLSQKGCLEIKAVSLDGLVSKGEIPPPDYMKIDVEGAELLVLSGAKSILNNYHPTIFLATHGTEVHQQCCAFLKSMGYYLQPINEKLSIDDTNEILAFREG
ncbi:MAG: FkbM family methyltransferase [Candidatus Scalinduaceae bacterium]